MSPSKRYEIMDFFRGIAIFLVINNHIDYKFKEVEFPYLVKKFFSFGTYGVQLFYIVSAFVLFCSLKDVKLFSFKNYIKKRLYRILPIFYIGVIVNIIYFFYFGNYDKNLLTFKNIILNFFFVNNFIPPSNTLIAGGETITCEVNFYFLLPIFFFFFNNYKKSILFTIFYLLLLIFVDLIFKTYFFVLSFGDVNFYRTIFVQLYVFSLGILLFHIFKSDKKKNFKFFIISILIFLVLSLIIISFKKTYPEYFYFRNMIFVSNFLFLTVCFGFFFQKFFINSFFAKILINLGRLTFSMYIFHWIVVDYLYSKYVSYLTVIKDNYIIFIVLVTIVTYLISKLVYPIEYFFIKLGKKN